MTKKTKVSRPIFELGDAFIFGMAKGLEIHKRMIGRYATMPYDCGILAQMIVWVGDGDHLEIGTLFGGSAILAALTKTKYDIGGQIICIDPLNGYYGVPNDPASGVKVSVETLRINTSLFAAQDRIEIVTEKSQPWPLDEQDRFVSAFIDGQHDYECCFSDWLNCKECVDKAILFHDYGITNPQVCNCIATAAKSEKDWLATHISGLSVVMAKASWLWPDYHGWRGYSHE